MENLMGILGVALALVAIVFLYLGGAAVVLRLVERFSPRKREPERDESVRPAAT